MVTEATKKVKLIQGKMKATQDRQKSYKDVQRKDLEFKVGELVYLKISPTKGVLSFKTLGKLKPQYIRPCEKLERLGALST